MGFEPTTLRDLVGYSNQWATGDFGEQGPICGPWLELKDPSGTRIFFPSSPYIWYHVVVVVVVSSFKN